jgi:hypothetical protein
MACTGPTFFYILYQKSGWGEREKKKVVKEKKIVMLYELNTIGGGG